MKLARFLLLGVFALWAIDRFFLGGVYSHAVARILIGFRSRL